ncbi:hypothetical protein [Variovorax sp. dw_954]|uniref:hypothetical protein n=1 Tax=Variovorax sp. dw_954 TaxID=2720078 RepID=UPI001BD4C457|nr:hypothetical protein [Variovorax sp. dw_954]
MGRSGRTEKHRRHQPGQRKAGGAHLESGNGREWGDHAFGEFLEVKAVLGFAPAKVAA